MPSPVLKCARGASSGTLSPPGAEMLAHHRGVGLEAAAGEDHGVGGERLAAGEPHAARSRRRSAISASAAQRIAERDARGLRGARQLAMDRLAAADRLDARRALGEIIDRLMELHAVRGDPLHRRGRVRPRACAK